MYSSDPQLSYWQVQAETWVPRVLGALAILIIAYILARAAKWAIAKIVDRVPALKKHYEAEPGQTLGGLIGDVVFWLILLVGIMLALQPLGLSQVLEPVRQLTNNTFAFVPNIIAAGLIFFIGLVVAKILRRIVEGAMLAANADGWLRRSGIMETAGTTPATASGGAPTAAPRTSISRTVGMLVFYIVMIPITIMALDALRIEVISGPATEMLQTIFDALPRIVAAVVLLAIGYLLGKLAKQFIEQLLPSAGFDRSVSALGFSSESTTPSRTVGTIVMIAILLFFAIKAAELLQSPIIAVMLAQLLELGGRVLFGAGIILGGFVFAKIASNLVAGTGSEGWLPAILKWSIIALSVAMGLRFMGLANEIVIIAFASIIGSAAIACALAFGLGGRPTAHKLLEQWTAANRVPSPPSQAARAQCPHPARAADDDLRNGLSLRGA
jgi:hypothetical protein